MRRRVERLDPHHVRNVRQPDGRNVRHVRYSAIDDEGVSVVPKIVEDMVTDTEDVRHDRDDRQQDMGEEIELGQRLAVAEARVELLERERESLRGDLDRSQRLAEQLASALAAEQQRTLMLLASRPVPQLQEEQQEQPQADTDQAAPKPRRWWPFTWPR